jgi:hypothetical protein
VVVPRGTVTVRRPLSAWHVRSQRTARPVGNNKSIVTSRRQKMALERGTNPKRPRRACSPRYWVPSCRGKSAGVAKRPRERSPRIPNPTVTIRLLFRRSQLGIPETAHLTGRLWKTTSCPTAAPLTHSVSQAQRTLPSPMACSCAASSGLFAN